MNKKVYFAGSIRGGRGDADLYARLIAHIARTDRVLTEHVGDLSKSSLENTPGSERAIYERDTAWIRECDVLIAECTSPSHGVGYEIAYAEKMGKEIHVFYDETRAGLSAMLSGNKDLSVHPYGSEDEAVALIDGILNA